MIKIHKTRPTIDFIGSSDAGLSILRSQASLRSLEVESNHAVAELETDDQGLADLLDTLVREGVRMRKFNDKDPTLEDVFMSVTKGLVT